MAEPSDLISVALSAPQTTTSTDQSPTAIATYDYDSSGLLIDEYDPRAFRMLVLKTHYRRQMEVGPKELGDAQKDVEGLDMHINSTESTPCHLFKSDAAYVGKLLSLPTISAKATV